MSNICIKQALILAAGKGSRLNKNGETNKGLVNVKGKPLICNIMDNMIYSGVDRYYIVVDKDSNFSIVEEYYKKSKIYITFIIDAERKGSLWSFQQSKEYIKPPFICADCDLIIKNEEFDTMLIEGIQKINDGRCEGTVARVVKPSYKDTDMLLIREERAIAFDKEGVRGAVRGGYIYIWNFESIFKEAEKFISKGIFSFSKYVDYIFKNHNIAIMDIIDLWDVDTNEDIIFTNNTVR